MITESTHGIQRYIQAQNMHRGFSENAALPVLDVHLDKFCDFPFVRTTAAGVRATREGCRGKVIS